LLRARFSGSLAGFLALVNTAEESFASSRTVSKRAAYRVNGSAVTVDRKGEQPVGVVRRKKWGTYYADDGFGNLTAMTVVKGSAPTSDATTWHGSSSTGRRSLPASRQRPLDGPGK
jgi:hypothetical protein